MMLLFSFLPRFRCSFLLIAALLGATRLVTAQPSAETIGIKSTSYPPPTDGTARFIALTGHDTTGTGTLANPWRSLSKAVAASPAGSTLVFRAGNYRGPNNTNLRINKRLNLQPYPGEKVWFKGSVVVSDWVKEGPIWRKQNGWPYSFPRTTGNENISSAYPLADNRDMVFLDGTTRQQVATKAEVGPGKFCVDYANKQLYLGDDPVGHTVESTAFARNIEFVHPAVGAGADGSMVRGLGFAHLADHGMINGASGVRLENNTSVWNGVRGLTLWGGGTGRPRDNHVSGNNFSYNGRAGVGGSRAHALRMENNVLSFNNAENYNSDNDAAGVKIVVSDSITIRNNRVEGNKGIWIDISCTYSVTTKNTVFKNARMGIFFEISHKGIIAGNLIYDNLQTGIHSSNSSSLQIWNNTIVGNERNIYIDDTPRNNVDTAEIARGIDWIARDHVIKNNLLSNPRGTWPHLQTWHPCGPDYTLEKVSALDYNGYYRTSIPQYSSSIYWIRQIPGRCGTAYPSVASFHVATGFEANGLELIGGNSNPFFVNEASNDYRLKDGATNPAYRRGQPLPADVATALGWPAGSPVSLGAEQPAPASVLPDLVVTALSWQPAVPQVGDRVVFSVTVRNQGPEATPGNITHGVGFLVNGTKLTWSDNSTTSMAPGESRVLTASDGPNGTINYWTASAGSFTITAHVDDVNRIPESVENNNQLSRLLTVGQPTVSTGSYYLLAKHSGQALDVFFSGAEDGVNVQQWPLNGTEAQQWFIQPTTDGYYTLTAKSSGKLLDVSYSSTADGANVWQWSPNGTDAQQWRITPTADGYYTLTAKCSGKLLDVYGISLIEGADVVQSQANGGNNQQWRLLAVGSSAARLAINSTIAHPSPDPAGEESPNSGLRVYPNPVGRWEGVTVHYWAKQAGPAVFRLADLRGRSRWAEKVALQAGDNRVYIPVGLPAGMYLVQVEEAGRRPLFGKLQVE